MDSCTVACQYAPIEIQMCPSQFEMLVASIRRVQIEVLLLLVGEVKKKFIFSFQMV